MLRVRNSGIRLVMLFLFSVLSISCGEKDTPIDTNLLKNSSFEAAQGDVPRNWQINNFRGLSNAKAAVYGFDETDPYQGERSFYYEADLDTERFFVLSQEVEVIGVRQIRIRAAIKTEGLERGEDQYAQANVAVTFYDQDRTRFQSVRFADARTELREGTSDGWVNEETVFPVPTNTRYIVVHCVLGMSGKIWFDEVTLDVPQGLPWNQRKENPVFTHYWLTKEYPDDSIVFQMDLYAAYSARLGIPQDAWRPISYYLYPDSLTMRAQRGGVRAVDVDYEKREIHSTRFADNHEIVHLLTDPYGRLPRILGEGTAFYMMDDWLGQPIQPQAQQLLQSGDMPPLQKLIDPVSSMALPPATAILASASFVGFLVEYGGPERFLELHRQTSQTQSYDAFAASFEATYDGSLKDAEESWRVLLRTANFQSTASEGEEGAE